MVSPFTLEGNIKMNKKPTYEEDYNELLNDLAEARNAANLVRSERLKDDSSPFNPSLTEEDAAWVIKKSIEANEKEGEVKKTIQLHTKVDNRDK